MYKLDRHSTGSKIDEWSKFLSCWLAVEPILKTIKNVLSCKSMSLCLGDERGEFIKKGNRISNALR